MAEKKKKDKETAPAAKAPETENTASPAPEETAPAEAVDYEALYNEAKGAAEELKESQDKYLRLLAEYDNYRKRSQKEREAVYADVKAASVKDFLPVYDNLERALSQPTEDEAYRKGVEMIMNQFCDILKKLNVESFGEAGEVFDPNLHSGVMHVEDEALGENVIAEVFQKGFKLGDKVIRFAMVKVAN